MQIVLCENLKLAQHWFNSFILKWKTLRKFGFFFFSFTREDHYEHKNALHATDFELWLRSWLVHTRGQVGIIAFSRIHFLFLNYCRTFVFRNSKRKFTEWNGNTRVVLSTFRQIIPALFPLDRGSICRWSRLTTVII